MGVGALLVSRLRRACRRVPCLCIIGAGSVELDPRVIGVPSVETAGIEPMFRSASGYRFGRETAGVTQTTTVDGDSSKSAQAFVANESQSMSATGLTPGSGSVGFGRRAASGGDGSSSLPSFVPRPVRGCDRDGCTATERLQRFAVGADLRGVGVQSVRGLTCRCAGDRAVPAGAYGPRTRSTRPARSTRRPT